MSVRLKFYANRTGNKALICSRDPQPDGRVTFAEKCCMHTWGLLQQVSYFPSGPWSASSCWDPGEKDVSGCFFSNTFMCDIFPDDGIYLYCEETEFDFYFYRMAYDNTDNGECGGCRRGDCTIEMQILYPDDHGNFYDSDGRPLVPPEGLACTKSYSGGSTADQDSDGCDDLENGMNFHLKIVPYVNDQGQTRARYEWS